MSTYSFNQPFVRQAPPRPSAETLKDHSDPYQKARILKADLYKQRILQLWDKRACVYDQQDTFHRKLALKLVELADVKSGQRILDIATGTGMVALPAAKLVGTGGKVHGIDISGAMISEARKKAKRLELSQASFSQEDADLMQAPPERYDTILCSSGMLYLQDVQAAIEKFSSWLEEDGMLCFNTPQEPCVPATAVFYELVAQAFGIELADAAEPLATAEIVKRQCLLSGFKDVQIASSEEVITFKNVDAQEYAEQIWRSLTVNAILTPLDGIISSDDLDRLVKPKYLERVRQLAEPWVAPVGVANPYTMLWVKAFR